MIRHSAQIENSSITQYLNILEKLKGVLKIVMFKYSKNIVHAL